MRQLTIVCLLVSTLLSCSPSNSYRDISEFNIKPNALEDGEPIKLLFATIGKESNRDAKYYNQIIVISQKTGDTVNILTPADHGLLQTDGDKIFNYIGPNNIGYAISYLNSEELDTISNVNSIRKPEVEYTKVIRNPQYDRFARNHFPTVIGMIGTVSNTN